MRIAFIGLGNMGGPMALNIAKYQQDKKNDFIVFDLDKQKAVAHLAHGALWAETPAEAVKNADIIFTSLPGPAQLTQLALSENNILDAMSPNTIWVELSTNDLETEQKIRTKAAEKSIEMLDAPVSGGTEGAAAGNLTIMVGGKAEIFQQCYPILKIIGDDVQHLGDHGAGYVAKIAQVVLCYLHSVALSEALMLGVKGGVKAETMLQIIQNSTGRSYVADRYGPEILNGNYDPGFDLGLAHKDMKLTLELAQSVGAVLPICTQVENIYAEAVQQFGFHQNHLMAVKILEDQNEQPLRAHEIRLAS